MARIKSKFEDEPAFCFTSMIDIVFLLLIFFLLQPFKMPELKLDLPMKEPGPGVSPAPLPTPVLVRDGRLHDVSRAFPTVSQLLNAWTMRSWEFSAFSVGLFTNRLMLLAMAVELVWVWALLNVPAAQKVFNTAHVPLADLWILLPFPVLLLLSHESYKWLRRHRNSRIAPQPDPA